MLKISIESENPIYFTEDKNNFFAKISYVVSYEKFIEATKVLNQAVSKK